MNTNIKQDHKLVIFDLDGVLIDSKEIHYVALNEALSMVGSQFIISPAEHVTTFDGLSTSRKLDVLHTQRGLPKERFEFIWSKKQELTLNMLGNLTEDEELVTFLGYLKGQGAQLALASNSIRATVDMILKGLNINQFFDLTLSNEDVKFPKPHPEIYWRCMSHFGVFPGETTIFEDSHIGRQAAIQSGAHLIPVDRRSDLDWNKIIMALEIIGKRETMKTPWKSHKLNVLIPMAGAGSRFETAGYTFPKPLVEVNGKPMIQVVVENLNLDANFIFIVQKSHFEKYHLGLLLNLIAPGCKIVQTDGVTEGAACTTLLAESLINNESPLLIANSDQFLEWNSSEILYSFESQDIDGGIVTFQASHPKWSFVKIGEDGFVTEVAEKRPISNIATVGVYYWKSGASYVSYAKQMISKNLRTNGEFYVCPVFNEAILDGKKIRIRNVKGMWGLGTPEDLAFFVENFQNI